jgi:hypothetical protein
MEIILAIVSFLFVGITAIVVTISLIAFVFVKMVASLSAPVDYIISPYGYKIPKKEIEWQMDGGLTYDEAIDWIESELQVNEILGGIMGDR